MSPLENNIPLLKRIDFLTDFRPYSPIMVLYFAEVSGSYTLAALLFTVAAWSSTALEVPTGMLSDRIGRKGVVISAFVAAILGLSCDALANSFTLLSVGSVLMGLSFALNSGNTDALLYESIPEETREREYTGIYGKVSAMFQLGLGLSAILCAILVPFVSYRTIFAIGILPQIVGLLLSLRLEEPMIHTKRIQSNIFTDAKEAVGLFVSNVRLRLMNLRSIINFGIGEAVHDFQSAFVALFWPTWTIGIVSTISSGLAFLGTHEIWRWKKHASDSKILFESDIARRIIGLILTGFPSVLSPALLSLSSLFFGTSNVTLSSMMQREFSDHQRATMGSLNALAGKLFLGIMLLAIGWSADEYGLIRTLFACEILLVSIAVISYFIYRDGFQLSTVRSE